MDEVDALLSRYPEPGAESLEVIIWCADFIDLCIKHGNIDTARWVSGKLCEAVLSAAKDQHGHQSSEFLRLCDELAQEGLNAPPEKATRLVELMLSISDENEKLELLFGE